LLLSSLDNRKPEKVPGKTMRESRDKGRERGDDKKCQRKGSSVHFVFWILDVRIKGILFSREEVSPMSLVGRPAPDFGLEGYSNGQFSKYKLSDYRKKWVLLLFYPLDFTFVCPTEVLNFSAAVENFSKLNCQIFGISVDSIYVHKAWVDTKREDGGLGGSLNYPLLSDLNKVTAEITKSSWRLREWRFEGFF
jgi:peroxiredoxin